MFPAKISKAFSCLDVILFEKDKCCVVFFFGIDIIIYWKGSVQSREFSFPFQSEMADSAKGAETRCGLV